MLENFLYLILSFVICSFNSFFFKMFLGIFFLYDFLYFLEGRKIKDFYDFFF